MAENDQKSQNPPQDTKPAQSWPLQGIIVDRQIPPASSALICCLSCLCTGLLFIIIILFVTLTRQGVNQMEQEMEVKLRNLSLGVHSRVEGLSQHGLLMMEKLAAMQSFVRSLSEAEVISKVGEIEEQMRRILSDEVAGSLSNDNQRILIALGELADEIWKKNDTVDSLCGKDWVHNRLSCYQISKSLQSWSSAKQYCEEQKGHLVVINDKEEMDFLRTFLQSFSASMWIGLKEEDSLWKWVDGTSYDKTPKFWKNNRPYYWEKVWLTHRYGKLEECGLLENGNDWQAFHCSVKFRFICEKKMS